MEIDLTLLLSLTAAYLVGSISNAVLVCRLFKFGDPRQHGSGNPGSTNVLRIGGKKAAFLTLLLDVGKGVFCAGVALRLLPDDFSVSLVGLAVVLGHVFPIFFRFNGGKGVATAWGVILTLSPLLGLGLIVLWLVVAMTTRYASIASLSVTLACPPLYLFLHKDAFLAMTLIAAIVVYRHKENIVKLLKGEENTLALRR